MYRKKKERSQTSLKESYNSNLTADEIEKGIQDWMIVFRNLNQQMRRLIIQNRIALAICVISCLVQVFITSQFTMVWTIILCGIQIPMFVLICLLAIRISRLNKKYFMKKREFLVFLKKANAADPFQKAVLMLRKEN